MQIEATTPAARLATQAVPHFAGRVPRLAGTRARPPCAAPGLLPAPTADRPTPTPHPPAPPHSPQDPAQRGAQAHLHGEAAAARSAPPASCHPAAPACGASAALRHLARRPSAPPAAVQHQLGRPDLSSPAPLPPADHLEPALPQPLAPAAPACQEPPAAARKGRGRPPGRNRQARGRPDRYAWRGPPAALPRASLQQQARRPGLAAGWLAAPSRLLARPHPAHTQRPDPHPRTHPPTPGVKGASNLLGTLPAIAKRQGLPGDTIHTLYTSNGSPYQNFQGRIM
jgi:hypothetical protein